MTTFLFWNLYKKPLQSAVVQLALNHEVDVILLAECGNAPGSLLAELNQNSIESYHFIGGSQGNRIQMVTRFSPDFSKSLSLFSLSPPFDEKRLALFELQLPGIDNFLIAVAHLPSKQYKQPTGQFTYSQKLGQVIRAAERQRRHSRTILVGDLNMNPFESGVVSATALHGVASRDIALRRSRWYNQEEYPFFYNPMWSLLGDATPGPPGTYYYRKSEDDMYFWHMIDQVLVRPDLLSRFQNQSLEILTSAGEVSLLTSSGLPDNNSASDHLPILFHLDFSSDD